MCTLSVLVLALNIASAWCATMVPPPAVVQLGLGGLRYTVYYNFEHSWLTCKIIHVIVLREGNLDILAITGNTSNYSILTCTNIKPTSKHKGF